MKKLLLGISLIILFFTFSPLLVFADVPNPNYFTAKCNSDEIEVRCSWSRASLNSPINDGCVRYDKNPNYRFLEGTGSTFGGRQKFCFKAVSVSEFISYHINALLPLLLITLLLEIPVFFILGFRNRKALSVVLSANLISIPLLYLSTIFLPFTRFIPLMIMELIVVVFEATFMRFMLKEIGFRKILIYSFIANAISAILGGVVLNIIGMFLMV